MAISISVLGWSLWPETMMRDELPVIIEGTTIADCNMSLEWTPLVRTGDEITIILRFGGPDTLRCAPNLSEQFPGKNLLIEASLVFPGLAITPQTVYITAVELEHELTFSWKAHSKERSRIKGTLWVFVNTVTATDSYQNRFPILAREFNIESRTIMGFGATWLRTLALLGVVAGITISLLSTDLDSSGQKIK